MALPFGELSFPEMYEQALVAPLFRPWAELILDDVALSPGERVLDVACGTGIVARLARARVGAAGTVLAVDVSAPMLAVARRLAPDVEWREGDACALPLRDDERFDVVLCQQGLQFFRDRAAAVRGMHRALTPGGRLAVSTWRADDEAPFVRELRRVAERHLGPIADRRHAFGDAGLVEALLRDAGFRDVRSKSVPLTIRFDDGSLFLHLNTLALIGMSAAAQTLNGEERERVVAGINRDSAELVQRYSDARGLAFQLKANVAAARS